MNRVRRSSRGYTLVELFAVVAIMMVLATVAIYGVRRYLLYAKTAEAGEVLSSIQAGEESYFEETFRYLDVTGTNFYPAPLSVLGDTKVQWGAEAGGCSGCRDRFLTIGVTVNQPVAFRYSVRTGATGSDPAALVSTSAKLDGTPFAAVATAPQDHYVAVAASDLDADGDQLSLCIASSFQGQMYTEDMGE